MRKGILVVIVLAFSTRSWASFERVEEIEKSEIDKVLVSPFDDNLIYAASGTILFKSNDGGVHWKKLFVGKENIDWVYLDGSYFDNLYLVCGRDLFRIHKDEVKRIFSLPPQRHTFFVAKERDTIYIGTDKGIYTVEETSGKGKKLSSFGDSQVYCLDFSSSYMYLASNQGVYVSSDRKSFNRVFIFNPGENKEDDFFLPRIIKRDIFDENKIYLGTSRGVFFSPDAGRTWQKLFVSKIENLDIRCISQTPKQKQGLYLATNKGAYYFNQDEKVAYSLFEGIPTLDIRWLDFDRQGRLFLATEKGLYFRNQFSLPTSNRQSQRLLEKEPSIREVQEAALRWNEVHPDKIRKWRKRLLRRGWCPKLNIDVSGSVDDTYEIYTSSTKSYYVLGPEDRRISWGVSLTWDLGELIWNSYEDDIDTRSRLTTQMRINILDDVNRVYFERLRLKREILLGLFKDERDKVNKELRLRELTATLDGYTGGYFSQRMQELNHKN